MSNVSVSQEMFDSIVREVVEEIGVPAATLVRISAARVITKSYLIFIIV